MTQTPRTDAQLALGPSGQWADFARGLERDIRAYEQRLAENARLLTDAQRIATLEQTLREVRGLLEPHASYMRSHEQALALIDRTLEGRG